MNPENLGLELNKRKEVATLAAVHWIPGEGLAGGSPHTQDLVSISLIVVVGVAVSQVDDPRVISIVGHRRRGPKPRADENHITPLKTPSSDGHYGPGDKGYNHSRSHWIRGA